MQQRLAEYRVFWRQFREQYHTTGAVLPSGRGLSRGSRPLRPQRRTPPRVAKPRRILEVGPGTGAVTSQIVLDMRPTDQSHAGRAATINSSSISHDQLASAPGFQTLSDRIALVHSGVEELPEDEPYDLIISGLAAE